LQSPRIIDRYALFDEIAAGGMGVVHVGRLVGSQGFARIVAIKRLHPNLAKDPEFVEMFVDEARLAARIRHPNVVITLDVVEGGGEVLVVMDYVHGATLSKVFRLVRDRGDRIPREIAAAIMHGALQGLHAAHEAKTEHGATLGLVHRDVSPQNIMLGVDGVPRVLDFGVAKAAWRAVTTRDGQVKGKLAYMAPEQVHATSIDRRVDVYAAGIVFWEILTGRRLFEGDNPLALTSAVLGGVKSPPSSRVPEIPKELDAVVMKALALDPDARYQSALEMAVELERVAPIATTRRVGEWLAELARDSLDERARYVADVESKESLSDPQIRVALEGEEPATKLVPPSPPSMREPGSVSRAVVTAETLSAPLPPKRSLTGVLIGAVSLLGLVGVALIGVSVLHRSRGGSSASTAASVAQAPTAIESPPPEPVSPPAILPASPSPPSSAIEQAATNPTTKPASKPIAPIATVKTSPVKTAAAPTAAKCDPPYTVDAKGVRVPKRECF
jgi:eukaryotic-like serine/threonine-protein kinase